MTIATDQLEVDGIALNGTHVFWGGYHTQLLRSCVVPGCATPDVVYTEAGPVIGVALDTSAVYWSVWEATRDDGAIRKCLLPDCTGGPITMVTGLIRPGPLTINTTTLFWTDGQEGLVGRSALGAVEQPSQVLADEQDDSFEIVVVGDSLYWLVGARVPGTGSLRRCVLPDCDGATPEILLDGLARPKSLVAGQSALYWSDESNRNIQTCALPTCAGGGVAIVSDLASPGGLTISQDELFWADSASIYHCTLPACARKTRLVDVVGGARNLAARADTIAWADLEGTVAYVAR